VKPTVYVETSIIGYLTSRLRADPVVRSRQFITRRWWEQRRSAYDICILEAVLLEIMAGDRQAAVERADSVRDVPVLPLGDEAYDLAGRIMAAGPLPPKARIDATHLAVAALHNVRYLLTWNFTHIANDVTRPRFEEAIRAAGLRPSIITSPDRLMGVPDD
jgi:predicted nucleic acid-binding protein